MIKGRHVITMSSCYSNSMKNNCGFTIKCTRMIVYTWLHVSHQRLRSYSWLLVNLCDTFVFLKYKKPRGVRICEGRSCRRVASWQYLYLYARTVICSSLCSGTSWVRLFVLALFIICSCCADLPTLACGWSNHVFCNHILLFPLLSSIFFWLPSFAEHFLTLNFQTSIRLVQVRTSWGYLRIECR